MDLQDPGSKMSTTGGSEQGTVYVLDEPDAIRKKLMSAVTDSGTEVAPRRRQGGDREPDRDPRGRPRRRPGGDRGRVRRLWLRGLQDAPSPTRSSSTWRRCASATRSCAATRWRSRRSSAPGREKARAIASATLADVRDAMGVGVRGSL